MQEVVGVSFRYDLPFIVLLNVIFVALFLSKVDGVLLTLEVEMRPLKVIRGRLPAHQWIFPPMATL